jgi:hypothetical protein
MKRRLGLLSEILDSELTHGLASPNDDEPTNSLTGCIGLARQIHWHSE